MTVEPTDEQYEAVGCFMAGLTLAVQAGAGCLAGDTVLHLNRGGIGRRTPISRAAAQLAGVATQTVTLHGQQVTVPSRRWDPSIPTMISRAEGHVSRLGQMRDAWFSGVKPTFEVATAGGRTIRATADHPFLTTAGWMTLGELRKGAEVMVNAGRSKRGRAPKRHYRQVKTRFHPAQTADAQGRWKVPTHRAVVEAELNGLTLPEFLRILRTDPAASAALTFLDEGLHVHHRDENHLNNARANLAVLPAAEHLRHHSDATHVLWQIGTDTVEWVRPYGDEETYDVAVTDDPHNFIANGFVVHNTGKTTLMRMMGESTTRPGAYTAFNRAAVAEAHRKMPRNVTAKTVHGFAYGAVGRRFAHRIDSQRIPSYRVARILNLDGPFPVHYGSQRKMLQPQVLAGHVMRAVNRFCQSADDEIGPHHLAYIEGIDLPTGDGKRTWANNDRVREYLIPALRRAWSDVTRPDGELRFSPDVYVKLWQMGDPVIPGEFLLSDESQDLSEVMLAVIERQAADGTQIVLVGDSCQPPDTLVSTPTGKARLGDLRVGDRVVSYGVDDGHFYTRGDEVKGVTERPFEGDLVVVEAGGSETRFTPDHHCVADPSPSVGRWVTYMMRRAGQYRVGACQWAYDSGTGPVVRARQEHADAVWVLDEHTDKRTALAAEAVTAGRFGLPTITFYPVNGTGVLTAEVLAEIWEGIGPNGDRAAAALAAAGRMIEHPLWEKGQRLAARRVQVMRACNLLPGWLTITESGVKRPMAISRQPYAGLVVSLDVDRRHTYIADGLVTHNCQAIYGFRGCVDALRLVEVDARTRLTQSWRFGPAVAEVANACLAALEADLRLVGAPTIASAIGELDDGDVDAVLCRTNAVSVEEVLKAIADGRRPHLVGGGDEVCRFANAALTLQRGEVTYHPELACFTSWGEVQAYAEEDALGGELRLLVDLVDEFGADTIVEALAAQPPEAQADVVVSTAHKAKGREWDRVRLAGDFPDEHDPEQPEQTRLAYVAVTRARRVLDCSAAGIVARLLPEPEAGRGG